MCTPMCTSDYQCISQLRWREGQDFPVARSLEDMKKEDPEVFGDPAGKLALSWDDLLWRVSMLFCYIENGVYIYIENPSNGFSETFFLERSGYIDIDPILVCPLMPYDLRLRQRSTTHPNWDMGVPGTQKPAQSDWAFGAMRFEMGCVISKKHCLWVNQISRYMSCFL
jgi:hypothetical protein